MITFLVVLYLAGFIVFLGAVKEQMSDAPIWACLPAAILWPIVLLWGIGAGMSKVVKS